MPAPPRCSWLLLLALALAALPARALVVAGELDTSGWLVDVELAGDVVYAVAPTNRQLVGVDVSDPSRPTLLRSSLAGGTQLERIGSHLFVVDRGDVRIFDVSDPEEWAELPAIAGAPSVQRIAVEGTRLYAADAGVRIFDASDPAAPEPIGHWPLPANADPATDLRVRDQLVYLAMDRGGVESHDLVVVDASAPATPAVVGSWKACCVNGEELERLWLHGSRVYLTSNRVGMRIVDMSDPAQPAELPLAETLRNVRALTSDGGHAWLGRGHALEAWNLSDPAAPLRVGRLLLPYPVADVVVRGDTAFVANEWGGLRVVDLAEPDFPRVRGGFALGPPISVLFARAAGVAVAPPHVFVADGDRVRVVDVSDPDHPEEVAHADPAFPLGPLALVRVALEGGLLVAAGSHLEAFDVSDPLVPVSQGWLAQPADDVALDGSRAYLTSSYLGGLRAPSAFHVVDVANPSAPQPLDSLELASSDLIPQSPVALELAGGRAHAGVSEAGFGGSFYSALDMFDVSGPVERVAAPNLLLFGPWAFTLSRPFLFVAGGWGSASPFEAYDLRAPTDRWGGNGSELLDPIGSTRIGFPGTAADLALAGGVAYLAAGASVWAVDVRDPRRPRVLGGVEVDAGQIAPVDGRLVVTAADPEQSEPGSFAIVDFGPQYQLAPEPAAALSAAAASLSLALLRRHSARGVRS